MRFLLLALALVSAPALSAPPCTVPGLHNVIGQSYHIVRGRLIKAGFTPVMTATDPNLSPIVNEPRSRFGYGEVSDCSGTGFAGCVYNWRSPKGQAFNIYAREMYGEIRARENPISCGLNDPYKS